LELSVLVSINFVDELIDEVRDYWGSSSLRSEGVSTIGESARYGDRDHMLVGFEEGEEATLTEVRVLKSGSQLDSELGVGVGEVISLLSGVQKVH